MRHANRTVVLALLVVLTGVHCGGSGAGSNGGSGSGPWSLRRFQDGGVMTDCTNFPDAPRPSSLQGATISSEVCPADGLAGVCSGTNPGGYKYQQVFYDPPATPASIPYLMLNCAGIGGTWSSTYVPSWGTTDGGAKADGANTGSAGAGGTTGGTCADLAACCAATTDANFKSSCMMEYNQLKGLGDTYCGSVLTGYRAAGACK
jgi:hypothetical protein